MGKTHEHIDEPLRLWLEAQPLFFVATAPTATDGRVNCSPKGLDTFRVLEPGRVAYLDLHGSGIETVAHLRENGRIVLLFCAFQGAPRIVRLHGRGVAHELHSAEFAALRPRFPALAGARTIVEVRVERVAESCGYGVPRMGPAEPRDTLVSWAEKGGEPKMSAMRARNRASIDGLPGLSG